MDEVLRQKLITAINEENLSNFRDAIPYLRSVSMMVKLKEIVYELVDHCLCKKFKITKLLIQETLKLRGGKMFGLEFLHRAIRKGDVEAAKELIYLGVDIHNKYFCFLNNAMISKRLEIAELLLAKGLNVNATVIPTNSTPLHAAVCVNYAQGVEFLLNHGAQLSLVAFKCFTPLHTAANRGSLDCMKILLDRGADINQTSSDGTPLEIATKKDFVNCVTYLSNHQGILETFKINALKIALTSGKEKCGLALINSGVNIFARMDDNYLCSLHAAAQGNCVNAIKVLLERGIVVNLSTRDNRQPLHFEVSSGHLESAELLLNHGACVDAYTGQDCKSVIHAAIESGNVKLVELLIQRGVDVNSRFRDNSTLHTAIKCYQPECVILLVNRGADVNAYNAKFKTPLYKAVKKSSFKVIEHLINNGADVRFVNGPDQETPLHVACEKGYLKTVRLLIDHGADINASTTSLNTPLSKAIAKNQEKIIQVLLDRGANISKAIGNKLVFHLAAERGYSNIIRRILESGANVACKDQQGYSAIHFAALSGNYQIVKLLLNWGEYVDSTTDGSATTPLQLAAHTGHYEIVKLLIDQGANVNYSNNEYWAAIHFAAKRGCLKSVKYLLSNGSKVNFCKPTSSNTSPLFIAAGGGHIEVFLAILDCDPNIETIRYILFDYSYYSHLLKSYPAINALDYNRIDWKIFDQTLVKVIMKLQFQKKIIPQKYEQHLEKSLELSKLRKDCQRELNRMKTTFVQDYNVSLFDFFIENHCKSVSLLSNNAVIEAFRTTNFKEKFPLYAELIMRHFKNSLERKEFLDEGKKYLQALFPKLVQINLIDKVFDYFQDQDICRLITVFNS